jgi:hypothetical protein
MPEPVLYKILQPVQVRREPRIIEYRLGKSYITNIVGMYSMGDIREVIDTQTDTQGRKWGRVSDPDPKGKADWFCIRTLTTIFAEPLVEDAAPKPKSYWINAIDAWARLNGYTGPKPP